MAVSRRLRYEILRRDNHACTYCGATAPDVKLTVDHVVPVALGGSDEPSNLTTACADCNGGKSASSPDAPIVAAVEQDALRWSKAMERAAEQFGATLEIKLERRRQFARMWANWKLNGEPLELPTGWEDSVDRFVAAGLPLDEMTEAVRIAMTRRNVPTDAVFNYMCGVCWNKVTELQQRAQHLLSAAESDGVADDGDDSPYNPWNLSNEFLRIAERITELEDLDTTASQIAWSLARDDEPFTPDDMWYGMRGFRERFNKPGFASQANSILQAAEASDHEERVVHQYLTNVLRTSWELGKGLI